jgi:hypothetical protein
MAANNEVTPARSQSCDRRAGTPNPHDGSLRVFRAISGVLRWVLLTGIASRLFVTTSSIWASIMDRGAPGGGSSSNLVQAVPPEIDAAGECLDLGPAQTASGANNSTPRVCVKLNPIQSATCRAARDSLTAALGHRVRN